MSSASLAARRDRAFGAGAPLFYNAPLHIVRGEGVYLYDPDGRRYVDMYNNVPCVGHANPDVVEAMSRQQATLNVHSRYLHEGIVDFADRLTYQILPPLKAGMVVLADRYVFTAFARDVARGVDPEWVRSVYRFAFRPDLTLYFRVPIETSLERLLAGRAKLKYHEAGMDVGLSTNPEESFRKFQSRVLRIYDELTSEFDLRTIDATGEIPDQQRVFRGMVQEILVDYDVNRAKGSNGDATNSR